MSNNMWINKKIKNNLKIYASEVKSNNCGIATLQLVLMFYKQTEDVVLNVKYDETGVWISDLASESVKQGFQSQLYCYSTTMFLPEWFTTEKDELLEILTKAVLGLEQDTLRNGYTSLINYLKLNSEFLFKIITPTDLKAALHKGKMCILSLESRSFHLDSDTSMGHYCLLESISQRYATVYSLTPSGFVRKRLPTEQLMFSLYRWGGWVLLICP